MVLIALLSATGLLLAAACLIVCRTIQDHHNPKRSLDRFLRYPVTWELESISGDTPPRPANSDEVAKRIFAHVAKDLARASR